MRNSHFRAGPVIRAARPRRDRRTQSAAHWSALGLLCLALFVDVMGSTSVFTASPAIQRGLALSRTELQWTLIAATLPAGALLMVGGRLADRYGRLRRFSTGLALLILSSRACGTAPTAAVMIAARVVQGLAGALLLPAALTTGPLGRRGPRIESDLTGHGVEPAERPREQRLLRVVA